MKRFTGDQLWALFGTAIVGSGFISWAAGLYFNSGAAGLFILGVSSLLMTGFLGYQFYLNNRSER